MRRLPFRLTKGPSCNIGRESQPLPEKFKNEITDERSDHSNCKIDLGKNIFDSPSQAPFPLHTRARKFRHQKIGIKEEDYKTDLGYCSPDIYLHPLHLNVFGGPTTSRIDGCFRKGRFCNARRGQ